MGKLASNITTLVSYSAYGFEDFHFFMTRIYIHLYSPRWQHAMFKHTKGKNEFAKCKSCLASSSNPHNTFFHSVFRSKRVSIFTNLTLFLRYLRLLSRTHDDVLAHLSSLYGRVVCHFQLFIPGDVLQTQKFGIPLCDADADAWIRSANSVRRPPAVHHFSPTRCHYVTLRNGSVLPAGTRGMTMH
jgi:hypothetical protein